ncbi:hypothetical protein XENORESO_008052, partial [Xenotaenia resolanae]
LSCQDEQRSLHELHYPTSVQWGHNAALGKDSSLESQKIAHHSFPACLQPKNCMVVGGL